MGVKISGQGHSWQARAPKVIAVLVVHRASKKQWNRKELELVEQSDQRSRPSENMAEGSRTRESGSRGNSGVPVVAAACLDRATLDAIIAGVTANLRQQPNPIAGTTEGKWKQKKKKSRSMMPSSNLRVVKMSRARKSRQGLCRSRGAGGLGQRREASKKEW